MRKKTKNFDKIQKEKDIVNIYSLTKSNNAITSLMHRSTNDVGPTTFVLKSKNKKQIKEIIQEQQDLEVEGDLDKIKIQWENNSFNNDAGVLGNNLDKSK